MLGISKINPMVRAIGTMGAIVAVAGGVTFAALQSNTVALSPNSLTSATAAIAIGDGTSCPQGDAATVPGLTAALVPGVASAPRAFCFDNGSPIPLTLTAQVTGDFTGSSFSPADVTLTLNCGDMGTLSGTLEQYFSPVPFAAPLGANSQVNCTETATLAANSAGAGGGTLKDFDVKFVGNQ